MADVLILLGSSSDLKITEKGLDILKTAECPFLLQIASAHRTPDLVHKLVSDFLAQGGKTIICVAGMSAHLAGVVAALTVKPVIAVPVERPATAGFDALLSMSQMPGGIPVATMGLGKSGFTNAALLALEILALGNQQYETFLKNDRLAMIKKVTADNAANGIEFKGN